MKLKKRIGYGVVGIMMGIALAATVGAIVKPSIVKTIDKRKVETLIAKEQLLKEAIEIYHTSANGDMTKVPQTIEALITRAKTDKLIPNSFSSSNGFGTNMSINIDGALLNIDGNIPSDEVYARTVYRGILGNNVGLVESGGQIKHSYSLGQSILKNAILTSMFKENYLNAINESNGTLLSKEDATSLDMNIAANKGVTYREYDASTNNYSVMGWDENLDSWTVKEILSASGATKDGNYVSTSLGDINASNVVSGSTLTTADGKQYTAINGDWVASGGFIEPSGDTNITKNIYGADNEEEYNRQLQEEQSANINVLTRQEAEATDPAMRDGVEFWEYDIDLSRYYIYKWSVDKGNWYVDKVKEINQYQETKTIAYWDETRNRYIADSTGAISAGLAGGNGTSLDVMAVDGTTANYMAMGGKWTVVEDNSYIQVDANGPFYFDSGNIGYEQILGNLVNKGSHQIDYENKLIYNYRVSGENHFSYFDNTLYDLGLDVESGKYYFEIQGTGTVGYWGLRKDKTNSSNTDYIARCGNTSDGTGFELDFPNKLIRIVNAGCPEISLGTEIPFTDNEAKSMFFAINAVQANSGWVKGFVFGEDRLFYTVPDNYKSIPSVPAVKRIVQEVDQPNWKKYKIELNGLGYKFKTDEGVQNIETGDYVYNVDNSTLYKRISNAFSGNLKSTLSGGAINYDTTTSWQKIATGDANKIYSSATLPIASEYKKVSIDMNTTNREVHLALRLYKDGQIIQSGTMTSSGASATSDTGWSVSCDKAASNDTYYATGAGFDTNKEFENINSAAEGAYSKWDYSNVPLHVHCDLTFEQVLKFDQIKLNASPKSSNGRTEYAIKLYDNANTLKETLNFESSTVDNTIRSSKKFYTQSFQEEGIEDIKIPMATLDPFGDNSLTFYSKLDGNSLDELGQHTTIDNAIATTTGVFDDALDLTDASSYFDIETLSDGNVLNEDEFAISLWLKANLSDQTTNGGYILSVGTYTVSNSAFVPFIGSTGQFGIKQYNNNWISSGTYPNDNEWHHLVIQKKNGKSEIYIDVDNVYKDTETRNLGANANDSVVNIRVGNQPSNYSSRPFKGSMDEIMFFNRALSKNEIKLLNTNARTIYKSNNVDTRKVLIKSEGVAIPMKITPYVER